MVRIGNFLGVGATPPQVEPVPIEFGEWLPDLPEVDNPGAVEALNVIPSEGCYTPFRDMVVEGPDAPLTYVGDPLTFGGLPLTSPIGDPTLPEAAKGAVQVFDRFGSPRVYAGTTLGLYGLQGSAFVKGYEPVFQLDAQNLWSFVSFGWSLVALHPQVAPLVADVGGDGTFSPLGGSPPIASCGARVGNFLVLGNLDNEADPDGAQQPQRIRWSGFNNIEVPWITDPATQADFNDMPSEGGAVTAISGREYGTVFQERSVSRMTYSGLPTVFDIETIEENRGAISAGAVADIGAFVFFIAEDGFYIWNGTNASPIGDNKVNRYFFNRLNYNARRHIVSAVDVVNKCVMWAFPTGSSSVPDEIIIYSYKENRFSHSDKVVETLLSGYTLDTSLDDLTGNLDTGYPISFDDDFYKGRRPYLAGFDSNHTFGFFDGAAREVTLDTAEYTGPGGLRVFSNLARPIVDLATPAATIQPIYRDQFRGETPVFGSVVGQEITEECPVLVDARYVRFRMGIPAATNWSHARGVELWRKTTGRR
jgi:hypothetical protein